MEKRSPWWVLGGLVAGVSTGLGLRIWHPEAGPFLQSWIEPWGELFLRLLFLLVIPVLLTALPLGIASAGSVLKLGRTALTAFALALLLGVASVGVALGLVNVTHPGRAMEGKVPPAAEAALEESSGWLARAVDLIPGNPFGLLAGWMGWGSAATMMLAILGLAIAWGLVLLLLPEGKGGWLKSTWERMFGVCMQLIGGLIRWAPAAVFSLTCLSFFRTGPELLGYLGTFVVTVLLALGLQGFGVYPLVLKFLGRYDLGKFWRGIREPLSTAFATASSNATLPVTLRAAEGPLELRPEISRFVLTAGASTNQNGTALYEGVTVIFLAQAAGVDLGLPQQAVVAGWALIASLGTAGVPGGTLPMIAAVLASLGVDPEKTGIGIALILGVDRFLDMCRTSINVTGDLVIAAVTDRLSGGVEGLRG
jgi:DAACS family dicarboxylate/amino acid:cation (Na+ or H+) symporter